MYTIYSLSNAGGVFYIGRTANLADRIARHRWTYGQSISFAILEDEIESKERATTRENHFIRLALKNGAHLINLSQRWDYKDSLASQLPKKYGKNKPKPPKVRPPLSAKDLPSKFYKRGKAKK